MGCLPLAHKNTTYDTIPETSLPITINFRKSLRIITSWRSNKTAIHTKYHRELMRIIEVSADLELSPHLLFA